MSDKQSSANATRPPVEVVLPTAYALILVVKATALAYLYATREVRAGGPIGHLIGWIGTGSMVAMHVYSLRRRIRALSGWGSLATWLHVHIFLGLQGALLVTFHSMSLVTLRNLSGATIVVTLVVVASGVFGRWVYAMLPKGAAGERLTVRAIEEELETVTASLVGKIPASVEAVLAEAAPPAITPRSSLFEIIRADAAARRGRRRVLSALKRERAACAALGAELDAVRALVERRASLVGRLALLQGAERLFRRWHLFHKPLTLILLGLVALHVVGHYIYAGEMTG
jgi:hypothetical protein